MSDVITDLRAIVAGATQLGEDIAGPIEYRTVDRIPVVLIRDAVAEIDRLRAHHPPAGLPAAIATLGDLDTVCSAAGLTPDDDAGPHVWTGPGIHIGPSHDRHRWGWTATGHEVDVDWCTPGSTAVLWAATRAVREQT